MYSTAGTDRAWSFALDQSPSNTRSRFNLLLLEHGEYYFQDYSVFMYPVAAEEQTPALEELQRRKVQGRLKFCSRSLVFEPLDSSPPLLRYPFKCIEELVCGLGFEVDIMGLTHLRSRELEAYGFRPLEPLGGGQSGGGEESTFFHFFCRSFVEMKPNGKAAPYNAIKSNGGSFQVIFSLIHSSLGEFLNQVRSMQQLSNEIQNKGSSFEAKLLEPILNQRLGHRQEFDTSQLVDFREKLLLHQPAKADRVTPLLKHPGAVMVTSGRIYFQPAPVNHVGEAAVSYPFTQITQVLQRRHMLRQQAIEIFLKDGRSIFFNFSSKQVREQVYNTMMQQPELKRLKEQNVNTMLEKWQRREISNFEYLAYLNSIADRSINDLTQYPVFPWLIQDYSSLELDLSNPETYRDLSKPIGALNSERLEYFKQRFETMPGRHGTELPEGIPPPFLYGTHYSTPGYVLFYLLRVAPEHMLCLQNGRYDMADRLFISMKDTWESVLQNQADIKELIPEFYDPNVNGDFLLNVNDLSLGVTQAGRRVGDVELPPWASSPLDFLSKLRAALESDHVSANLHHWIDLIFGFKQCGEEAIQFDNLFYYLTYEGAVDLEEVEDPQERAALESQISEFGQTPKKIFLSPHPSRDSNGSVVVEIASYFKAQLPPPSPPVAKEMKEEPLGLKKHGTFEALARPNQEDQLSPTNPAWDRTPVKDSSIESLTGSDPLNLPGIRSLQEELGPKELQKLWLEKNADNAKDSKEEYPQKPKSVQLNGRPPVLLHREPITDVCLDGAGKVLCTTSKDCSLKIANIEREGDVESVKVRRNFTGSDLAISCCSLTENAKFVIAGSWDNSIFMYSVESACVVSSVQDAHEDSISCLSLQGEKLATGSWDATVRIWQLIPSGITPAPLLELYDLENSIYCVVLNEDGSKVAAGAEDGMVQIWDSCDGVSLGSFQASEDEQAIHGLGWQGTLLFSGSEDGTVRCFEQDGQQTVFKVSAGCGVTSLSISSVLILTGCSDGSIRIWVHNHGSDISDCPNVIESGAHSGPVTSLYYNSKIQLLTSASEDCTIRNWDIEFVH